MVDCERWISGACGVVAELTGCEQSECAVPDEACAVCLACDRPKALNKVTASIGMAVAKRTLRGDEFARVRDALAPAITIVKPQPIPASGPGTELKNLLHRLGFRETPTCGCKSHAREMDHRGVDWCRANMETIVGWLRDEAGKQGLPFVDFGARMLIKYAIRRAS